MEPVLLIGLKTIPEVQFGDNIASLIIQSCKKEAIEVASGDIVVIASKIVSKSEGNIAELKTIKPTKRSKAIAKLTQKDPVHVELIRKQSKRIVAAIPIQKIAKHYPGIFENLTKNKQQSLKVLKNEQTVLITEVKHGLASEAGIDYSNNPTGFVSLLPANPNGSALKIRKELTKHFGNDVAVVITDTEVAFAHIFGSTEIAIGFSGIRPVAQNFAAKDRFGKEKFGGADIIVDEIASAAALLMGQTAEGVPVVIVHGLKYDKTNIDIAQNMEALSKGAQWTIFATLKLKLARLIESFM